MATERDIRLGLKVQGIDETRQNFEKVKESVKGLGDAGQPMQDAIVDAFQKIESASDKAVGKMQQGQKVSQASLDSLIVKYDEVKTAIEAAFPEGAPDELTAALQKAEDRIVATVKAADDLPSKLQAARDAFRDVVPAVEDVASAVSGPQTSLAAAIARVEGNLGRFRDELNTTGDVGKGEIEKITKSQHLLDVEIQKTVGSYDKLDTESKQAYDRIQTEAAQARQTVIQLEQANRKVEDSIDANTRGFSGFGDALQQMGGKAGAASVQIGLVAGAFQQGWSAGMQFNSMMKTDMSEWDEQVSLLGMRFKTTFEGIADLVIENGNLLKAVFTGDWEAFKIASDGLRQGLDKTLDGFKKTNDELRAQRDALKEVTAATEEKKKVDETAADAEKKRAAEVEAMIKAQNEYIQKKHEAAIAAEVLAQEIRDETAAVDSASVAYDKAAQALGDAQGQLQSFGILTDSIAASLEEARARAAALSDEYGENSSAAKNASDDVQELERSLSIAQQSTERASAAVDDNRQKQDEAAKAVEQHTERLGKLTTGQEQIAVTADKAAAAAQRLAVGSADSQGAMIKWSSGVDAVAAKMSALATASERSVAPLTDMSGGYDKFAKALADSGKPLDDTVRNLSQINDQLEKIKANAPAAAAELNKLAEVQ